MSGHSPDASLADPFGYVPRGAGGKLLVNGGLEGTRALLSVELGQFQTHDDKEQMGAIFIGSLKGSADKAADLLGIIIIL